MGGFWNEGWQARIEENMTHSRDTRWQDVASLYEAWTQEKLKNGIMEKRVAKIVEGSGELYAALSHFMREAD